MSVLAAAEFTPLDLVTCNGTKCLSMGLVIGCKRAQNMSWDVCSAHQVALHQEFKVSLH